MTITTAATRGLMWALQAAAAPPVTDPKQRAFITGLGLALMAACLGLLGVILAVVLIWRRRRWSHVANAGGMKGVVKRAAPTDAWSESAKRLQLPPDDLGADDDTRDFDPDDLAPDDIVPRGPNGHGGGERR